MPYKVKGSTVYVKKAGKWRKKAKAKSATNAKKMVRILGMWEAKKKRKR
jgi:hypothetical protein